MGLPLLKSSDNDLRVKGIAALDMSILFGQYKSRNTIKDLYNGAVVGAYKIYLDNCQNRFLLFVSFRNGVTNNTNISEGKKHLALSIANEDVGGLFYSLISEYSRNNEDKVQGLLDKKIPALLLKEKEMLGASISDEEISDVIDSFF